MLLWALALAGRSKGMIQRRSQYCWWPHNSFSTGASSSDKPLLLVSFRTLLGPRFRVCRFCFRVRSDSAGRSGLRRSPSRLAPGYSWHPNFAGT